MSKFLRRDLTTFLILSLFVCGCGLVQQKGNKNSQLLLETICSGVHGLSTDLNASIKWVTNSEQYKVIDAEFDKQRLSDRAVSKPDIDFDRSWALLIEMGQKSTGGYSMSLDKFSSRLSDETAVIRINWNIPDQGAMVTQMVTSPYLMLRLSKRNLKKIVVVDQEERTLFEADVPK